MALGEAGNVFHGSVHVINPGIFAHVDGAVSAAARRRLLEHKHFTVALVFSGNRSPQTGATVANNEHVCFKIPLRRHPVCRRLGRRAASQAGCGGCADSGKTSALQEITTRKSHFIPFHFVPLSKALAHEAHLQSPREVPFRQGEFLTSYADGTYSTRTRRRGGNSCSTISRHHQGRSARNAWCGNSCR